jgi:6-pyruvoyltetrahydropterin/6-carboxytetrahydropterin synthase
MGEALHVMDVPPTAENIAKLIFDYASQQNLAVCEVQFFETDRNFASYCG